MSDKQKSTLLPVHSFTFCDSGEDPVCIFKEKRRRAGQRSKLDLIHLLLGCIPAGALCADRQTDRLI